MENLNISSFFSTKIKDFLSKYDTDGSGVIEKENGELANLISGIKNGEMENIDSVSFSSTVGRAKAPKAPQNANFEQAVADFNNSSLSKRLKIAGDTRSYAYGKLNDMVFETEDAIIKALYDYPIVDLNMYKKKLGGGLESAIKDTMRAVVECYADNYKAVQESVQKSIAAYDNRYAMNHHVEGVTYFDTEDTRIIAGEATLDLYPDNFPTPEELANMSEAQRDAKLEVFAAEVELLYTNAVVELFNAVNNVEDAITTNHENTAGSIDEVAQSGNLTYEELGIGYPNFNPHVFNIKKDDPVTYEKFLFEIIENSNSTGIESTESDAQAKDGKYFKNGKVKIRKDGQVYNTDGQPVRQ